MKRIDETLHTLVEKGKTPSVQYLLFDQEKILHQYRVGFADVAGQKKTAEETTYHAYSVTKTFTALAVMQLAEQGKINIDKGAANYITDFPYSEDITVRHLLNHTAGIPNPNPLPWIHLAGEHQVFDRDAYFSPIFEKNSKVKSAPNKKLAYTNLGYVLLGQLIEQVSGMSYEAYIEANVIVPLGLSKKDLYFEAGDVDPRAKGYHKKNSLMNWVIGFFIDKKEFRGAAEGKWQPFNPYYVNGASYGGLIGHPGSFMIYAQELLKEDNKLISPEYKHMMFSENNTLDGKPSGMCLSWFTDNLNGKRYVAHAGGGGGYYCEVRLYPDAGIGSVIMFNRSGMRNEKYLDNLDIYYFEDHPVNQP
jgi:CubicO group peptidase (beta-lactamase class C family)